MTHLRGSGHEEDDHAGRSERQGGTPPPSIAIEVFVERPKLLLLALSVPYLSLGGCSSEQAAPTPARPTATAGTSVPGAGGQAGSGSAGTGNAAGTTVPGTVGSGGGMGGLAGGAGTGAAAGGAGMGGVAGGAGMAAAGTGLSGAGANAGSGAGAMAGTGGMGGGQQTAGMGGGVAAPFALTSPTIMQGGDIPKKHVCTRHGGQDQSPALNWGAGPAGTASYAILFEDLSNGLLHSAIWDIPAATMSLPENLEKVFMPAAVAGAKQSLGYMGSRGPNGYAGPCPSTRHQYQFTLHAVSEATLSGLGRSARATQVADAVRAVSLQSTMLSAYFNPR